MADVAAIEAERMVLGAMMQSEAAVDAVLGLLSPRDFSRHEHRLIWLAIVSLVNMGRGVDPVAVLDRLEADRDGEAAGGLAYVTQLMADCVAPRNVRVYADVMLRHAHERRLGEAGHQVLALAGGEDPIEERIDKAQQIVMALSEDSAAEPDAQPLAETLGRVITAIDERFNNVGAPRGLQSGLEDLDPVMGDAMPGNLIVIAARPSVGKSVLAGQVGEHIARNHGPVLFWSGEMSTDELNERSLARIADIDLNSLQSGRLADADWPRMTQAIADMNELPLYISERAAITPMQLRVMARRIKRQRKGLAAIVVDYLQLMRQKSESRLEEVSEISRQLKAIAKEMKCVVIALSQLNRAVEARTNKRPMMSDLRESGQLEQDADKILLLYRGALYGETFAGGEIIEIDIAKNRGGRTSRVYAYWRGEVARIESGAPQSRPEPEERAERTRRVIYSGVQSPMGGVQ